MLFGLSSVPQRKLVGLEAVEPLDEPGYLGDLWEFLVIRWGCRLLRPPNFGEKKSNSPVSADLTYARDDSWLTGNIPKCGRVLPRNSLKSGTFAGLRHLLPEN
jgi:hypothetical protein